MAWRQLRAKPERILLIAGAAAAILLIASVIAQRHHPISLPRSCAEKKARLSPFAREKAVFRKMRLNTGPDPQYTVVGGIGDNINNGSSDVESPIAYYNGSSWTALPNPGQAVWTMTIGPDGNLWVGFGSYGYSNSLQPQSAVEEFSGGTWKTVGNTGALPNSAWAVYSLLTSGSTVYAATDLGVEEWNGSAWSAVGSNPDPNGACTSLAIDGSGRLYVGTRNQGVFYWNGSQWVQDGFPGMNVDSLATDGSGAVWAGLDGAIYKLSGGKWQTVSGLASAGPMQVLWVPGTGSGAGLWAADTEYGQLYFYNSSAGQWTEVQRGAPGQVIGVGGDGSLWIGNYDAQEDLMDSGGGSWNTVASAKVGRVLCITNASSNVL